jgi:diguanylate cyclase (GGDEF)-like protein
VSPSGSAPTPPERKNRLKPQAVRSVNDRMAERDDLEDEAECTLVASRDQIDAALAAKTVRAQRRPTLLVVAGRNTIGKMLPLAGEMVIGRHPRADLHLDEEGVSRRHASLRVAIDGTVIVRDLGSTNGTFVNGDRVYERVLRDGDKIQIGAATILKFSYQDALDEALQRNLYDSATRDALTRLYNRKHFDDVLPREIAFARRHHRPLCVVMFDVDHFKRINDGFGHPAGDAVLVTLAQRVSAAIRAEDVFARVGGEEFALVLRDLDLEHGTACAERIRKIVAATQFAFEGRTIPVTISLGVAELDDAHEAPAHLVSAADRALYAAKHGGRNRVEVFRRAA